MFCHSIISEVGCSDEDLAAWEAAILDELIVLANFDYPSEDAHYLFLNGLDNLIKMFTDFMFINDNYNKEKRVIQNTLYHNPLQKVKIKMDNGQIVTLYAGFSDAENPFRDATLTELSQIFTEFQNYNATDDIKHFDRLLAILYRPGKSRNERQNDDSDDPRIPLENSDKLINKRIAIIGKQMPDALKKVVYLHILSVLSLYEEFYPEIFSGQNVNTEGGDWVDFVLDVTDYDPLKKDKAFSQNANDMLEMACRIVRKNKKD